MSKKCGCKSSKCKSSKCRIDGRITFCPDECELEKLKNDILEFLKCTEGSFSSYRLRKCLQDELCKTGVIDLSPAIVAASDNNLQLIINFPQECCILFDVVYSRRDGRVWMDGGCSGVFNDIIDITKFGNPKTVYVIYGCNAPCKPRQHSKFRPPKRVRKIKRIVECEDTESSSSSSESEECEVKCKKCKKVCKDKCGKDDSSYSH